MKNSSAKVAPIAMFLLLAGPLGSYGQTEEWRATFDFSTGAPPNFFPAQDIGRKIGFDGSGNVFVLVTTVALTITPDDSPVEYVVFKYDQDGNELWQFSGDMNGLSSPSTPYFFQVDPSGNVYGAFTLSNGTGHDAKLFKLNSDGTEAWSTEWNDPARNRNDHSAALAVDLDGNVYLVISNEISTGVPITYQPIIQKFDPDGIKVWEVTGEGTAAYSTTLINDIDTDADGDLFMLQRGVVRKYSSVDGTLMNSGDVEYWWEDDDSPPNPGQWRDADGVDLEISSDGIVYVAATATQRHWFLVGPGPNDWDKVDLKNFLTARFENDLTFVWRDEYGTYEHEEYPTTLMVKDDGNIRVTGPSSDQLVTLEYLPDGVREGTYLYSEDDASLLLMGLYAYAVETPFSGPLELHKYLLSTGVEEMNSPVPGLRTYSSLGGHPEGDIYLTGSVPDGETHTGATADYEDDLVLIKYAVPDCSDGIDNDGDDYVDYPDDPSCSDAEDESEARCFQVWGRRVCLNDRPVQVALTVAALLAVGLTAFFVIRRRSG